MHAHPTVLLWCQPTKPIFLFLLISYLDNANAVAFFLSIPLEFSLIKVTKLICWVTNVLQAPTGKCPTVFFISII